MHNRDLPESTTKTNEGKFLGFLRGVALTALVIGAIGSLAFMFRAGQQTPRLLLILFTIWVLSPFAALLLAHRLSKSWSALTRATLRVVMIIIALSSLAIYGEWINLRPAESANAFLFVAVPPASLLFIAIVVSIAAFVSGRRDGN